MIDCDVGDTTANTQKAIEKEKQPVEAPSHGFS